MQTAANNFLVNTVLKQIQILPYYIKKGDCNISFSLKLKKIEFIELVELLFCWIIWGRVKAVYKLQASIDRLAH